MKKKKWLLVGEEGLEVGRWKLKEVLNKEEMSREKRWNMRMV